MARLMWIQEEGKKRSKKLYERYTVTLIFAKNELVKVNSHRDKSIHTDPFVLDLMRKGVMEQKLSSVH